MYEFVQTLTEPVPSWALSEAEELQRLKIDIDVGLLGLPDAFPDGGWCIHQEVEAWIVYYSERGRRSGPAIFNNSFDAANFYLWCRVAHPRNENSDVGMLRRFRG